MLSMVDPRNFVTNIINLNIFNIYVYIKFCI